MEPIDAPTYIALAREAIRLRGPKALPEFPAAPMEWISVSRLAADAVVLAAKLPPDTAGVVGVPRSGLIPASIVATLLHLPLYELPDGGQLARLGHGRRGRVVGLAERPGQLVVVDDSVFSGAAMQRARAAMQGTPALFAAVYVNPDARRLVDVYARELATAHLLEWNLCNAGPFSDDDPGVFRGGLAFDLDGIIVHDAESGGPIGTPYLVPRSVPARLIATGRPEVHREATEARLRELGAKWERLEMYPGEVLSGDPLAIAAFKAERFRESGAGFFLESCPVQAEAIHRLAGKPVVCPVVSKVFQGLGGTNAVATSEDPSR